MYLKFNYIGYANVRNKKKSPLMDIKKRKKETRIWLAYLLECICIINSVMQLDTLNVSIYYTFTKLSLIVCD